MELHNLIKNNEIIFSKHINTEILKAFQLRLGIRQGCPTLPIQCLQIWSNSMYNQKLTFKNNTICNNIIYLGISLIQDAKISTHKTNILLKEIKGGLNKQRSK